MSSRESIPATATTSSILSDSTSISASATPDLPILSTTASGDTPRCNSLSVDTAASLPADPVPPLSLLSVSNSFSFTRYLSFIYCKKLLQLALPLLFSCLVCLFYYCEEFSIYQSPADLLVRLSPLSFIHPLSSTTTTTIPLRLYWSDFICYSMSSELETQAVTSEVASDVAITATLPDSDNEDSNKDKDPFADYTIRFAQYNFYMRPPGINSNGNDYKSDRLRYFIEHELDRFDVIAFQELFGFGSNRRATLLKEADARGFKYSVSSPRQCAAALRIDGGVVIISRFPIIRHASLTFDRGVDSDWLAAKGVVYAKLRVAGKQYLHVFSTHLQSSYTRNYPMSDQAVQIRLKQLYAARRFIDAQLQDEPSDSLIVFAGDLNVNGRADDTSAAEKGASSDEYQAALNILKGVGIHPSLVPGARHDSNVYVSEDKYLVQDLLYEHLQVHPETFADVKRDANNQVELDAHGQPIPVETILTTSGALCWRQRLDYILVLRRGEDPHSVAPNVTDPKSTIVEKFLVDKKYQDGMPTTQLSDHYGLSTVFKYT